MNLISSKYEKVFTTNSCVTGVMKHSSLNSGEIRSHWRWNYSTARQQINRQSRHVYVSAVTEYTDTSLSEHLSTQREALVSCLTVSQCAHKFELKRVSDILNRQKEILHDRRQKLYPSQLAVYTRYTKSHITYELPDYTITNLKETKHAPITKQTTSVTAGFRLSKHSVSIYLSLKVD
jgi:hypothetical protein